MVWIIETCVEFAFPPYFHFSWFSLCQIRAKKAKMMKITPQITSTVRMHMNHIRSSWLDCFRCRPMRYTLCTINNHTRFASENHILTLMINPLQTPGIDWSARSRQAYGHPHPEQPSIDNRRQPVVGQRNHQQQPQSFQQSGQSQLFESENRRHVRRDGRHCCCCRWSW